MRRAACALLLLVLSPALARAGTGPPPSRIVSLAPSLTEIVFALGAGDRLAGVTKFCDFPAAAKALPRVGGMEDGSIDFERVLHLKPDLVLAIGEGQSTAVETLRRLGLRVEVVASYTADDVLVAMTRIGALLGRPEVAGRLRAELERRFARVRAAVAKLPPQSRPRVFFEIWDRPLMTATRQTFAGQLIEMAGGVNVFSDLAGRYVEVSPEAILERNPQVILAPDYHGKALTIETLSRRPGLSKVDAVKHGRVHILPGDLISRPGPRMGEALEIVGHALHPDLVPAPAPSGGPSQR